MATQRVHLDHLILRESIRYIQADYQRSTKPAATEDRALRYDDILREEWFTTLRKPDFQRETNAWTPENCLEFLESVIEGRIIPSIILWRSPDSNYTYVLDGAHRLSVIRAWMIDDWGNSQIATEYYARRELEPILEAAERMRVKTRQNIGAFSDFKDAWREYNELAQQGKIQREEMTSRRFQQATFYSSITGQLQTLSVQWEHGNYESAEKSFLRINRSGQPLDPWESKLIEYRRSSYARTIMSIANGGESGHYWPTIDPSSVDKDLVSKVAHFGEIAARIHQRLFVPPFKAPITNLNVPLMIAPAYFQKHMFLFQLVPLVSEQTLADNEEQQVNIMKRDVNADANTIIQNADKMLTTLDDKLEHLIAADKLRASKSLGIAPLFYFYNQKGMHVRGLLYGFMYWLFNGNPEQITARKLVFSANRDRFEYILFEFKPEIAALVRDIGAGLKSTKSIATLFNNLVHYLHEHKEVASDSEPMRESVFELIGETLPTKKGRKKSRLYSTRDKTLINVRELFSSAIRCHICGGVLDLEQDSIQYDHVTDYASTGYTDPDDGKPTHGFCNRYKNEILSSRQGSKMISLPDLYFGDQRGDISITIQSPSQIRMPGFWGDEVFPD